MASRGGSLARAGPSAHDLEPAPSRTPPHEPREQQGTTSPAMTDSAGPEIEVERTDRVVRSSSMPARSGRSPGRVTEKVPIDSARVGNDTVCAAPGSSRSVLGPTALGPRETALRRDLDLDGDRPAGARAGA